jgi:hypothetical protein
MICGDFNLRNPMRKAGANRARSVIFTSGDDLANLEGALSAYERLRTDEGPVRLIWAQISNEQLADRARAAVRTRGKVGIRFFDTYRIASLRVVADYFDRTVRKNISEVVIIGFGKFGRDLLDVLINDLHPDEKFKLRVLDLQDREKDVRALAEEMGAGDRVAFERSAVQDLRPDSGGGKAYFICTDDDLGNLTTSMSLADDNKAARIYVRMDRWPLSGVAENVGEDRGIRYININDLLAQGIGDLPGIFRPARESDLKRVKLGTAP